jgi:RNA polymerase sigma factor (sigma-70 family)
LQPAGAQWYQNRLGACPAEQAGVAVDGSQDNHFSSSENPRGALLAAYLARRGDLVRFFTARMKSAAAAEDLIQDLYVRLASFNTASEVVDPSALLYRIAVNLMLDRLRGDRRTSARDQAWQDARGAMIAGVAVADEPSPEDAASARQRLGLLVDAVAGLPPRTRRAFQLHKLEGRSHAETARLLGVSRKTVEKQISAALRALLNQLGSRL